MPDDISEGVLGQGDCVTNPKAKLLAPNSDKTSPDVASRGVPMITRFFLRFVTVCVICSGTAVALAAPAAATPTLASADATQVHALGNCRYVGQLLTIGIGASGPLVRVLQCLLIQENIPLPDGMDGSFGPNTRTAVITYQSHNGLQMDGVVGPQTWGKLFVG